jgi:outer membrane protein OmpA-like peptidoglycan-associated protein/opacity protein-like surface antigen
MKKLYTITIMSLVTIFVANAQTSDSPWAVSLGANLVSIQDDSVDASTGFGVPSLILSRYIAGGFSIGAQYSLNSLEIDKIDADYTAIDAILKYNISEGDIFPYLFAGYGLSNFQTDADSEGLFPSSGSGRTYLGGAGVSFFISDNWIVNASTSYRSSTEKGSFNHLQHVVGFSYVFGAQDTDKDGVSDKKDVCPEVPGLKEFEGCPDTDGDGIPDNKDACPEEAGSAELNGCPDSDGDGLADNVDKCPQEAGEASNNGCPEDDRDGDGVADKDDACPDEAGAVANNGCPELPEKLAAFMQSENSTLLFVVNSSVVTDESSAKLKELTALLAAYSNVNVVIEGHASSDGSMVYNQTLSEKRANSVKDALVGMGVDASRLETVGYGETKPTADNKTAAGRSANRRVQFERKVQIKVVE